MLDKWLQKQLYQELQAFLISKHTYHMVNKEKNICPHDNIRPWHAQIMGDVKNLGSNLRHPT